MLVSPEATCQSWEIWVFAAPDLSEPVEACGLFHEEDDAVRAAADLQTWLHTGVWSDRLDPYLLHAREGLKALGYDPARTSVHACRYAETHDNDRAPPDAVIEWRPDAGHSAPRGPHAMPGGPDDDDDDDDLDDDDATDTLNPDEVERIWRQAAKESV